MNLSLILKKAWQILWSYRALWLFGAVLALVGANKIYPFTGISPENNDQWTRIKLSDATTVRIPGMDITIDLTAPGGFRIINQNGITWREFNDLVDLLDREASIELWPIIMEAAIIMVGVLFIGLVARYVTETSLMRMVDETEQTGKYLSVWAGLRRGFSFRAVRLFMLDLAVGMLAVVAFILLFGLAILPLLLALRSHAVTLITIGIGTFGFFLLAFFLWLAGSALFSLILQPIRRACALEHQGLLASIRQGLLLTKHHFTEIAPLWLIWMGLRLSWVFLIVPVVLLFVPFLLLTIPLGVALGGIPAGLVSVVTALFMDGVTPWIMGALVGLPIFIVVMISPILFVSGLLEIYMSSIWTLAYRNLKALELPVQALAPQAKVMAATGAAD